MKRFMILLLCVALVAAAVATTAFAATTKATVSSATGKPGETVTLTVSLAGFEKANSLAVEIIADSALQLKKDGSDWVLADGLLKDVDVTNKKAAWTATTSVDVNKAVLKLSFVIPQKTAGQTNFTYAVTCKVMVKNNADELGTETATGYITMSNPVKGLTLDKTSLTLDLVSAKEATLVATPNPADTTDALTWTSSNTAVATVVNGKVTAVGKGSATIKVTCGSYSKSCTVTVKCATHDLKEVPAKPASCKETGNKLYYICNACDGVFNANKVATTVAAQTIAKTSHAGGKATCQSGAICTTCGQEYGNKASHAGGTATCQSGAICTTCGQEYGKKASHTYATTWTSDANKHWKLCTGCNTAKSSEANHSFEWKVDKAATEDATGLMHEECKTCKFKRSENTEIPKKDHEHTDVTYHAAVTANCTREGNKAYYTCSSPKCAGKYYEDKACLKAYTVSVFLGKDPAKHTGGTEVRDKASATCSADGFTGNTYCKGCGQISKAGTVIPATGKHVGAGDWIVEGNQHWRKCACGAVTDKAEHTMQWVIDKAATEEATGLKHEECKVCKTKASENTVIEKLEHAPAKVAAKAATCTEAGCIEHFACPNCGAVYASENGKQGKQVKAADVTLAATGHTFGDAWKSDNANHWRECACGEKGELAAHTTELVGVIEATMDAPGYSGDSVCTVCQLKVSEGQQIPAVSEQIPETTQTPAAETTEAPQVTEPYQENTDGNLALILIVLGVAAAAIFLLVIVLKKRKK